MTRFITLETTSKNLALSWITRCSSLLPSHLSWMQVSGIQACPELKLLKLKTFE